METKKMHRRQSEDACRRSLTEHKIGILVNLAMVTEQTYVDYYHHERNIK